MAVILGQITVNEADILAVASTPEAGVGTPAIVGSLALVQDTPTSLWQKTSAPDTGWTKIDLIASGDLPVVQVRRTATLNVPASYADVTFDQIDVQNNSAVLERDGILTDRILVKETGLYRLDYSFSIDLAGQSTTNARIRIDDVTVIPGSLSTTQDSGDVFLLANSCFVLLAAGQFVSLQIQSTGGGAVTLAEFSFSVNRMKGSKGDPGITGSGSNIIVQDDGTNVTGTPHSILNFQNMLLNQSPVGTVNISNVFGSNWSYAESAPLSSTTSTTFQQKVSLTTPNLPFGTYRVGFYYNWALSSTSNDFNARIQINNAGLYIDHKQEPQDAGTDQSHPCGGFFYVDFSGVNVIDLDYRTDNDDDDDAAAYIKNARLEIWRVI